MKDLRTPLLFFASIVGMLLYYVVAGLAALWLIGRLNRWALA